MIQPTFFLGEKLCDLDGLKAEVGSLELSAGEVSELVEGDVVRDLSGLVLEVVLTDELYWAPFSFRSLF